MIKKHRRLVIAIGVLIIVAIAGVSAYLLLFRNHDQAATTQQHSEEYNQTQHLDNAYPDGDAASAARLVDAYQSIYDEKYQKLTESDPAKWSATDVADAQFCLIYTSKVGLTQQAQLLIGALYTAQQAGVQVYGNDFYLTQQDIDKIQSKISGE